MPHEQMFAEMAGTTRSAEGRRAAPTPPDYRPARRAGHQVLRPENAPWSRRRLPAAPSRAARRRLGRIVRRRRRPRAPLRHRRFGHGGRGRQAHHRSRRASAGARGHDRRARRQLAREPPRPLRRPQAERAQDPATRVPIPLLRPRGPTLSPTPSRLASSPAPEVSTTSCCSTCEKTPNTVPERYPATCWPRVSARPARRHPALEVGAAGCRLLRPRPALPGSCAPAAGRGLRRDVLGARNARLDASARSPRRRRRRGHRARGPALGDIDPAGFRPNLHS